MQIILLRRHFYYQSLIFNVCVDFILILHNRGVTTFIFISIKSIWFELFTVRILM